MQKKASIWVIEIGNYSTKLLKAKGHRNEKIVITDFLMTTKWTRETMVEVDKSDFIAGLHTFFKGYRRRDKVILLVGNDDLQIDFWSFPFVSEEEIEAMVYWKMKERCGDQLKDWHYDYLARTHIESYKNLGIEDYSIEALAVIISKELITNYSKYFKKTRRIDLNKILPQFYGIGAMLKEEDLRRVFFLDLGYFKTVLYDFKKGMLAYKMDLTLGKKQTLGDYLKMMRRSLEDQVQLDDYKNNEEKPILFLIGGGSLVPEIQAFLGGSQKYQLGSLVELLAKCDYLKGPENMKKEEIHLFFPAIAALIGE